MSSMYHLPAFMPSDTDVTPVPVMYSLPNYHAIPDSTVVVSEGVSAPAEISISAENQWVIKEEKKSSETGQSLTACMPPTFYDFPKQDKFTLLADGVCLSYRVSVWKLLGAALGLFSSAPEHTLQAAHQHHWLTQLIMPFMHGSMPLRRTFYYLQQGKIKFRDNVQCMCEIQGQHPCTSLLHAPQYMTGKWRWNHNLI
uniref:Genome assembly, chromosome: II n=1 Tax=Heterorhabditis bacteriophora TaxID=37862 RepID=A0A1I7X7F7_HETBA